MRAKNRPGCSLLLSINRCQITVQPADRSDDGTPHLVTYDPSRQVIALKFEQEEERDVDSDEIRNLPPIRAYSTEGFVVGSFGAHKH